MGLILTSPPLAEPVALGELKEFLRVDSGDTSQDNILYGHAIAARAWVETYLGRRLVSQTWRLLMDYFPGYIDEKLSGTKVSSPFVSGANAVLVGIRYAIALPYPPIISVSNFQYLNAAGGTTVMIAGTDYVLDLQSNPARLAPPFGQMWPVARVVPNAVQVDFVCGYATPISMSMGPTTNAITGHTFAATDLGRPILIPGAGANDGGTLGTAIASVDGSGVATTRDKSTGAAQAVTALLVNSANGIPWHFEIARNAIKMLVQFWYDNPSANDKDIKLRLQGMLYPARDMRR